MNPSRRLHWSLKALAGLLTLVVLAILLGPLLIPTGTFERELMQWTRAKTGLTLKIQGPVEVTIFPTLGLSLNRVALMNPKGFPQKPLIRIHHASIRAAFLPLMTGTIKISETTLRGVRLTLLTNRHGISNVSGLLHALGSSSAPARRNRHPQATPSPSSSMFTLQTLGRLDLEQVDIRYRNLETRTRESIHGLDLKAGPIEREHPFPLSLHLEIRSSTPKLDLAVRLKTAVLWASRRVFHLEHPAFRATFLGSHPTPLEAHAPSLEIALNRDRIDLSGLVLGGAGIHGSLSLQGTFAPTRSRDLGGRISLSLARLSPWLGQRIADLLRAPKTHPELNFETRFHLTGTRLGLTALALTLGSEKIAGQLDAKLGAPHPDIQAAFVGNTLSLAPVAARAARGRTTSSPVTASRAAKPSSWMWLHEADGEVSLRLAGLRYGTFMLERLNAQAKLEHGTLTLYPAEATGFGGAIALRGRLTAVHGMPRIHLHLKAQQLSLQQLSALLGNGHPVALSGRLSTDLRAGFTGLTEATIGKTLDGTGQVQVLHALWRGVDLRRIVVAVEAALHGQIPSRWPSGGKTRIGKLESAFILKGATATISKASLSTIGLEATGSGAINWLEPHLDLHLLLHPLAGSQPGEIPWPHALTRVAIPVTIEGTPSAPEVTPDLRSILRTAVRSRLQSLAHHLFGHLIPH